MIEALKDSLIAARQYIRRSKNHVYYVREAGGDERVYSGTTTCIDGFTPKEWLGGWYAKEAALEAEAKIRALKELTLDGVLDAIKTSKTAARRVSQKAKNKGTDLHELAEWYSRAYLGHEEPQPEITSPEVEVAWGALYPWLKTTQPILPEQPIFSRIHRAAGTADLIAMVPGYDVPVVPDFKTSKQEATLKPEYKLQSFAYRGYIREMTGFLLPGVMVVLPKEKPGPAVTFDVPWEEEGWQAFLALLRAYRWYNGYEA